MDENTDGLDGEKSSSEGPGSIVSALSMYGGLLGVLLWVVLGFGIAFSPDTEASEDPYMVAIGLSLVMLMGLNLAGIVLGIVGLVIQSAKDARAIIGVTINAVCIASVAGLVVIGIMVE